MQLNECFDTLKAGNQAIKDIDATLYYYSRVAIQNQGCYYFQEKNCQNIDDFYKLVDEVADAVRDEKDFYIDLLSKDCEWNFDDGKVTIHWADPKIGKLITVHLMLQLQIKYEHI